MLAPYRSILSRPGTLAFSAAGLLARMEMAMVGLGSVLLVQRVSGSYALGGAVAATLGVASALVAPAVARLVDRFGQAGVLRATILVHVAALIGLVGAALARAPLPLLFAAAALAGAAMPSVGSLVRARWARLVGGTPDLQTAFALEAVLDEVVFIVGPILVTTLAAVVSPAAGLLVAAGSALAGALLLAAQGRTEPRGGRQAASRRPRGSVLGTRGLGVLVLIFLATGAVFGSAEVAVAAFTRNAGAPAAAGLVLGLWAAGSMVSGLVFGTIRWRGRMERRLVITLALFAVVTVPMAIVTTVPALAVVFLIAGVTNSPALVTGTALTEALVPAHRLTEGLAWTNTALSLTYALGAAVGGIVVDEAGPRSAFLVPVACGALGLVAALAGLARLVPARSPVVDPATV